MTPKTLTREDVIRAVAKVLYENNVDPDEAQMQAAIVADALGLVAPKPFEREAWAKAWKDGTGLWYRDGSNIPAEGESYRVIRVRITEIPEQDGHTATEGE